MQETESVLRAYGIKGAIDEVALFGYGHINDSFKVRVDDQVLLLQKVNASIFKLKDVLENNFSQLLRLNSNLFPKYWKANGNFHLEHNSALWRLSSFIENSYSPVHPSFDETLEAVRGYGKFMFLNSQLDVFEFNETIPNFHSLENRLDAFEQVVRLDLNERLTLVTQEVDTVRSFQWIEEQFKRYKALNLPVRVCHNDTKSTNVLLDSKMKKLLKVVDLDTVGPGYAFFDFGDMMRSMLASHPENEPDIDNLSILEDRYEHMLEEYTSGLQGILTEDEMKSLGFGGLYMTYLMAIRFLTDYLKGDIYYRIAYPEENLVRARNQLKLLELMKGVLHL